MLNPLTIGAPGAPGATVFARAADAQAALVAMAVAQWPRYKCADAQATAEAIFAAEAGCAFAEACAYAEHGADYMQRPDAGPLAVLCVAIGAEARGPYAADAGASCTAVTAGCALCDERAYTYIAALPDGREVWFALAAYADESTATPAQLAAVPAGLLRVAPLSR